MTYAPESKTTSVPWDSTPKLAKLLTTGEDYSEEWTMLDEYNSLHKKKERIEALMKDLRTRIDAKMIAGGALAVLDGDGNQFIHRDSYTRITLDTKWAEKRLMELGEKSKEVDKHKTKTTVQGGLMFRPAKPEAKTEKGEE